MNLTIENILLVGSVLLFLSIIAGKTSYRFGVPTLVLFLGIGMLAGSDGIGGIHFDNPKVAQFIGIVSLNFILFSGGLDTSWKDVRPVMKEGFVLSTLGVLLTALFLGLFVHYVTDFSLLESLLLGSIVSSTDAAAVFSILRARSLALKQNLRPTLELESGSNDPMAYVLTITFLALVQQPELPVMDMVTMFFRQMLVGGAMGYLAGKAAVWIINKIKLDFEGLYPVLVISLMFIIFSMTDAIGGNGFLAIYISAVYLGNNELIHKKTILKMFDGLAWLMQIVLFLTLGLQVFPSQIVPLFGVGVLISSFLIFAARPASVFISLIPFKMNFRRKLYISWVGLRGAVPIVFATYPMLAGIEKAQTIFNIVFFVSLSSVLLQGTTLSLVARWLGVALPEKLKKVQTIDQVLLEKPKQSLVEFDIDENAVAAHRKVVELNFPKHALITMIKRGDDFITPNGFTKLLPDDHLYVLLEKEELVEEVEVCLFGNALHG
jgi:cell volume regulation protein A